MPINPSVEWLAGLMLELRYSLAERIADEYEFKNNPYFLIKLNIKELIPLLSI